MYKSFLLITDALSNYQNAYCKMSVIDAHDLGWNMAWQEKQEVKIVCPLWNCQSMYNVLVDTRRERDKDSRHWLTGWELANIICNTNQHARSLQMISPLDMQLKRCDWINKRCSLIIGNKNKKVLVQCWLPAASCK